MSTRRDLRTDTPQTDRRHPDEYERDLNPDRMAGQNLGEREDLIRASDLPAEELPDPLRQFDRGELQRIPVVRPGAHLKQGATYVDLNAPRLIEFQALGDQTAGPDNVFVPKRELDHVRWNRMLGREPREERQQRIE